MPDTCARFPIPSRGSSISKGPGPVCRGNRGRIVLGLRREAVSRGETVREERMKERRNVQARETGSSIDLVGTLDPARVPSGVNPRSSDVLSPGRAARRPHLVCPGTSVTPSSPLRPSPSSTLLDSLSPPPSSARPRPRLQGGAGPAGTASPSPDRSGSTAPSHPGQREPRLWPAWPGQARVPCPGPLPRAMEPRPPGSRRVSHPAPPLSQAPAAAAAPPPPPPPHPRPPLRGGLPLPSPCPRVIRPILPNRCGSNQSLDPSPRPDCRHHTGYPGLCFSDPRSPPNLQTSRLVLHLPSDYHAAQIPLIQS